MPCLLLLPLSFTPHCHCLLLSLLLPSSLPALRSLHNNHQHPPSQHNSPLGAYFLFSNDVRGKVKADNPELKVTEIAKAIGEMWGKATDKEKEKYQKKADEVRLRQAAAAAVAQSALAVVCACLLLSSVPCMPCCRQAV